MLRRVRTAKFSILIIPALLLSSFGFQFTPLFFNTAHAAVPLMVDYQGRLEDTGGNPLGGTSGTTYTFHFSVWNVSSTSGGTMLWPSGTAATATLPVYNGVFDARLGDSSEGFPALSLDFNTSTVYYLQVEVFNSNSSAWETLSPRQAMVSSGFAINASTLNGFTQGTSSNNILQLDSSGNINLPAGQIRPINTSSCAALLAVGGGSLCYDTTNNNLFVWNSASSTWAVLGGASSSGNTTLQQAFNLGNTINTTSGRSFALNIVSSTAGSFLVQASGSNSLAVTFSTISLNLPTNVSSTLAVSSTLTVGGTSSLQGLTFTNATATGNLQAATLVATGLSSLQGVTFANATGTTINTSGNGTFGSIMTTGQSSLAAVSSTNLTASGYLAISGQTSLASASATNITASGNLSGASLNVSGASSFQGITFSNATGTGTLQSGNLIATGVSTLQGLTFTNATGSGNLQIAGLTATGQSSLTSVSSTNLSATGYALVGGNLNASGTITQSGIPVLTSAPATTTINQVIGPTFTFATSTSGTTWNITTSSGQLTFTIPQNISFFTNNANFITTGTLSAVSPVSYNSALGQFGFSNPGFVTSASSVIWTAAQTFNSTSTFNSSTIVNGQLSFGSASGTNLTASGYLQGATLGISGQSSLAAVSSTNLSASGFATIGTTLNVSGQSTLASVSSTNQTLTGYLAVAGQTSLASASATNVTASGYLQGGSLNISGVSALQGITFTNATGTGSLQAANLIVTGTASTSQLYSNSSTITGLNFGNATSTGTLDIDSGLLFVNSVTNRIGLNTANPLSLLQIASTSAQSASSALVLLGPNLIQLGNVSGTFIGANPGSPYNGDFLNFQVNSSTEFQVAGNGNATIYGVASSTELRSPSSTLTALRFTNASGTNLSVTGYGLFPTLFDASGNKYSTSTGISSIGINGFSGTAFNLLGSGSVTTTISNGSTTFSLINSGVASGTYTNPTLTISSSGLVISASNGSAGGGSVSTSSAISANNFPFWATTGGALSGTSTLTISGTQLLQNGALNASGTITQNGTAVALQGGNISLFTNNSGFVTAASSVTWTTAQTFNGTTLFQATSTFSSSTIVNGQLTFGSASGTNLSVTGYGLFPTLFDASGNKYVTSTSGGGITAINQITNATITIQAGSGIQVTSSSPNIITITNTGTGAGSVNGTGTTNYYAVWTGASTLGTSTLQMSGGNLLASSSLLVSGTLNASGTITQNGTAVALQGDNISEFINNSGFLANASITASGPITWSAGSVIGFSNPGFVTAASSVTWTALQTFNSTTTFNSSTIVNGQLSFGSASGTNLTASGYLQGATLGISGQSSLAAVSSTNLSASGFATIGSTLNVSGQTTLASASGTNISVSGYGLFPTLSFTNASGTNETLSGYLAVSGQTSLGNASATNVTASGNIAGASLNVSGQSALASVSSTNLTASGYVTATGLLSATVTGGNALLVSGSPAQQTTSSLVQIGPNIVQGGSVSGTVIGANYATPMNGDFINLEVNSSTEFQVQGNGNTNIYGVASSTEFRTPSGTIATLKYTNASGTNETLSGFFTVSGQTSLASASATNITASGNVAGASLNVSGQSTLASVSSTNLSASGFATIGSTLNVSGQTTLASASSTNLSASGFLTVGTTLAVSGQSTLASASSTNLTASGYLQGGSLSVSGQSSLASVSSTNFSASGFAAIGSTLNVSGQTTFASASGTNVSVTGYGLFPTLYDASGNKYVTSTGISSVSINGFSGAAFNLLGSGSVTTTISNGSTTFSLINSGVASGTYTNPTLTISSSGLVVSAANGSAGGGSVSTSSAISANNFPFWATTGGALSGTSTLTLQGTGINASGTITQNGTAVALQGDNISEFVNNSGFVTAASSVTWTANQVFNGRIAVGTSTLTGSISIQSSTAAASGNVGIAGIYQSLTFNPSTAGGFNFGNRTIVNVAPTASTTAVGEFVRMIDNTSLVNTVRGIEVQAYSGTSTTGVNTGIIAFGRTFGIQGITTGEAGGVSIPAGVYGELQNGTQGNAIRAYTATSTSADLVSFYQESSNFAANGLVMNFGNSGGSFTGNFLNLQRQGITKFNINATGTVVIASSSAAAGSNSTLTICAQSNCTLSSTSSASVVWVASVDGTTGTNSIVAKGSIVGNAADFAEYVPVSSSTTYEPGDILSITSSSDIFGKSSGDYDSAVAGAISQGAAFVGGIEGGTEGKQLMTVAGRIQVKVSGENGTIAPGDYIAAASLPGYGMKATQAGRVVGMALEPFDAATSTATSSILVLINPHWYAPPVDTATLQGGSTGTGSALNTYSFDPNTIYDFNNLVANNIATQNLTVGASSTPSGITLFDTVTKNPYCVIVENGILKAVPGACGTQMSSGTVSTSFFTSPSQISGGNLGGQAVSNTLAPAPTTNNTQTTTSGGGTTSPGTSSGSTLTPAATTTSSTTITSTSTTGSTSTDIMATSTTTSATSTTSTATTTTLTSGSTDTGTSLTSTSTATSTDSTSTGSTSTNSSSTTSSTTDTTTTTSLTTDASSSTTASSTSP